jgi:hypothetical protein
MVDEYDIREVTDDELAAGELAAIAAERRLTTSQRRECVAEIERRKRDIRSRGAGDRRRIDRYKAKAAKGHSLTPTELGALRWFRTYIDVPPRIKILRNVGDRTTLYLGSRNEVRLILGREPRAMTRSGCLRRAPRGFRSRRVGSLRRAPKAPGRRSADDLPVAPPSLAGGGAA